MERRLGVRSIFVGRQQEMAVLEAALNDALSGQGRLVMLAGEPGIGKTRTAQELTSLAETLGAQVLWGRCYEEAGVPPYWPWIQSLRSYIQQRDPDGLRSEMGAGAADIAEVIPDVREKLPDLPSPPTMEPEQARFRLYESITGFLRNATLSRPIMMVLDDLQWADKSSLALLQFLARELDQIPMLLVGCYRDVDLSRQHPLSESLSQLNREPVFRREQIRGLSREATREFIEAATGIRSSTGLDSVIHAHTEGNPFFMTEVIRLLREQGELTGENVTAPVRIQIPEGVREVIGQRLNRLSRECDQVLTTASIIGREFDFNLLNTLESTLSEDQLLGAMDEALGAHLIEELAGSPDRYYFSHALIQQALNEELSTSRRVRLHVRVGEELERRYEGNVDTHVAELAYHFAQAESVLGTEKLVHYSLLAGEQALAAHAYEEALVPFQRGLVAKEGRAMDGETATLLFGAGRSQLRILPRHELGNALDYLNDAFDYYAETGDISRAVAVAEYPIPSVAGRLTEVAGRIRRALDLVSADSHQAGRLLSPYAWFLGVEEGDYGGAQEATSRALAIAQKEGDGALQRRTLINAFDIDWSHMRYSEGLEKSLQVIDLTRNVDDPSAEMRAHYRSACILYFTGNPKAADVHATASMAPAQRLRDRFWLGQSYWVMQGISRAKGDWGASLTAINRGLELTPTNPGLIASKALLECDTGDFEQALVYLDRLIDLLQLTPPGPTLEYAYFALLVPGLERVTGFKDHSALAEEAAYAVLSEQSATIYLAACARLGLSLLAAQSGNAERASEQYGHLVPIPRVYLAGLITSDRILGLLSQTMGNLDQATEHFEDSLTFCRKAGYLPELAWTCHDYADTLLQRNGPGDHEKAKSLMEESLSISTELGMRPLMERVAALQERAEAHPARAPAYPDGLSHREVEVLRLIAAGKSNREIAEELFISPNTAGHHVSNLLNKTGSSNRVELANYAARHDLAP